MRLASGTVDQYIYFVAVDATDLVARETGLSSFTVYRSRNGGAAAAFTTPTINETDSSNMPGVYELLLDEDMTIDSGDTEQAMVFHITHAGMAPVTLAITVFRPAVTAGETLTVSSGNGAANVTQFGGTNLTAASGIPEVKVNNIAANAITATSIASDAITAAKIANGAIDAATFAADVDAEILSYIVDDATRIDASALNTATGTTIPAILDDTDLIDDGTSGLAKIATDVAAILVDTGTTLQAELDGIQADTEDIQSRLPAALVSGRIDASVGAMAANVMTAAAAAADLTTELQNGLATASAVSTLQTSVDDLPTNAELATALGTADDAVLTQVALIKTKTDSLTFTVAGKVDSNIEYVNGTEVTGVGTEASPWGP